MAAITYDDGQVETIGTAEPTTPKPGHARSGPPLFGAVGRAQKVVTGSIAFDAAYPVGGEDISKIFALFADFGQAAGAGAGRTKILVDQPITGAQTGKFAKVDHATRKIQLFTAVPAEVAASDQSLITALSFIAVGPR